MKTFLLNSVQSLKNYSQKLDAQEVLYNKSWEVFNESGDKELMIFSASQELLISSNGIVQKGRWELLDISNMIIDAGDKSYLLNASYIEDNLMALKLDGTNEFIIMIEADKKINSSLNSIESIENYLLNKHLQIVEKARKEEEEKIKAERLKKEIQERKEEERLERVEKYGIKKFYLVLVSFIINILISIALGVLYLSGLTPYLTGLSYHLPGFLFWVFFLLNPYLLNILYTRYDDMKLAKKLRKEI